jgi:predicted negative regulator of RcsB-dependent stress response
VKNGQNADATLYEHLGDVYFKLKNESKALENWKIALSKDPKNEQIIKKIKTKQIDE